MSEDRTALVKRMQSLAVDCASYADALEANEGFIPEMAVSEWREWSQLAIDAIAALTPPPVEAIRQAQREVLEQVRAEMQKWRDANAREGVWTADQMLGHVLVWLAAQLAMERGDVLPSSRSKDERPTGGHNDHTVSGGWVEP